MMAISVLLVTVIAAVYFYARWNSYAASFVLLLLAGICAYTFNEIAGTPKTLAPPLSAPREASTVIAVVFDEPDAIYVWLHGDPPVAWKIPWSTETARQYLKAQEGAANNGTEVVFEGGDGEEYDGMRFYEKPTTPLPPKP